MGIMYVSVNHLFTYMNKEKKEYLDKNRCP